jgi:hypothetical protein
MSQVITVAGVCPICELKDDFNVHTVVDTAVAEDKPLLRAIQDGQFNVANCLACGTRLEMELPIVFHVPEEEVIAIYVPNSASLSDEQLSALYMPFYQNFLAALPDEALLDYLAEPYIFDDPNVLRQLAADTPISQLPSDLFDPVAAGHIPISAGAFAQAFSGMASTVAPEMVSDASAPAEEELTLEELDDINRRMALVTQLFATADAPDREQILSENAALVDRLYIELLEVLAEQAASAEPEKVERLVLLLNEAWQFSGLNPAEVETT